MLAHTLIGPAMFSAAAQAAVRVAAHSGYASTDPFVLQESNNTVVWLRPHAVIAKVGKWPHSADALALEHAVATAISAAGAPIAPPLADVEPARDEDTGFLVTLWQRLEDTHRACPPAEVARALRELHEALPGYDGALPPFEATLLHAQAAALGDRMRAAVPPADRLLVIAVFEQLIPKLRHFTYAAQPLHGEPHLGNLLLTREGPRWIDLENVCVGPLEWDLTFLPETARAGFPDADTEFLALLATLNSAWVATWCSLLHEFPEIREHGRYHLEQLRRSELIAGS